jgi:hypothetical protein
VQVITAICGLGGRHSPSGSDTSLGPTSSTSPRWPAPSTICSTSRRCEGLCQLAAAEGASQDSPNDLSQIDFDAPAHDFRQM